VLRAGAEAARAPWRHPRRRRRRVCRPTPRPAGPSGSNARPVVEGTRPPARPAQGTMAPAAPAASKPCGNPTSPPCRRPRSQRWRRPPARRLPWRRRLPPPRHRLRCPLYGQRRPRRPRRPRWLPSRAAPARARLPMVPITCPWGPFPPPNRPRC
jgi:hypothetical protein